MTAGPCGRADGWNWTGRSIVTAPRGSGIVGAAQRLCADEGALAETGVWWVACNGPQPSSDINATLDQQGKVMRISIFQESRARVIARWGGWTQQRGVSRPRRQVLAG